MHIIATVAGLLLVLGAWLVRLVLLYQLLKWLVRGVKWLIGTCRRAVSGPPPPPAPPDAMEPDSPVPFGYKTGWLCIRSEDPAAVMDGLDIRERRPCNWARGLGAVSGRKQVFVSPALEGWVLVIGITPEKIIGPGELARLAGRFAELQYFGTHRVVEYCGWALYREGRLIRGYTYEGDRGQVTWEAGTMTLEEVMLGGDGFPHAGVEIDWDAAEPPGEDTVLDLAAAWGVDPLFRGKKYPPALGWLCELP